LHRGLPKPGLATQEVVQVGLVGNKVELGQVETVNVRISVMKLQKVRQVAGVLFKRLQTTWQLT